jgi:hypothetical protein
MEEDLDNAKGCQLMKNMYNLFLVRSTAGHDEM